MDETQWVLNAHGLFLLINKKYGCFGNRNFENTRIETGILESILARLMKLEYG